MKWNALGINIYLFLWAFQSLKRKALCLEDVFSARERQKSTFMSKIWNWWSLKSWRYKNGTSRSKERGKCGVKTLFRGAFYDVPTQGCEWDVCWVCLMENTQNISIIYDIHNKLRLWGGVSFEFSLAFHSNFLEFFLLLNSTPPWSFFYARIQKH